MDPATGTWECPPHFDREADCEECECSEDYRAGVVAGMEPDEEMEEDECAIPTH
jgi:hypothetical protein